MVKKLFLYCLALFAVIPLYAQRPKVGVVLCGGGAKGAAHVGVLKVLEENHIPIDYIAGTSMGAIIGGLYAVGYSAKELDSLIMIQDWDMVMSDNIPRREISFTNKKLDDKLVLKIPFGINIFEELSNKENDTRKTTSKGGISAGLPMALIRGQNIYNLFTGFTIGYQDSISFDMMAIPFACVAVDLVSKKEVVFRSGILSQAMRASMAIPGVFAPLKMGDMLLVDGGVRNNYPVDVAKKMGADIIIGVKLGEEDEKTVKFDNLGDVVNTLIDMVMEEKYGDAIKNTDILITPTVKGYNAMSFAPESLRILIDNGEKAARDKEEEIKKLRAFLTKKEKESVNKFFGPKPLIKARPKAIHLCQDSIIISSITFKGISSRDGEWLLRKTKLKRNEKISGKDIEDAISMCYSTSAYSSVSYALHGTDNPYEMEISFVPSPSHQFGLGIRFDSEEITALLIDMRFNHMRLYGSSYGISMRLSYNYYFDAGYSYAFKSNMQFNTSYRFRRYDMGLFNKRLKFNNIAFDQHSVDVSFSTNRFKDAQFAFGGKYEFFDYTSVLSESDVPHMYDINKNRPNFLSIYTGVRVDRLDNNVFPKRGLSFNARGSYFFDIFKNNSSPFSVVNMNFLAVAPVSQRFAMLPFFHGRLLIGDNIPAAYMNVMGGYEEGRFMEQQMPFYGWNKTYAFRNYLGIIGLDLRQRIGKSHYIFAGVNYALHGEKFKDLFSENGLWGCRLGYAFNLKFGPLAFNLHWSDYTSRVGAYVSLGYWF